MQASAGAPDLVLRESTYELVGRLFLGLQTSVAML
jgi:hypothetical protein